MGTLTGMRHGRQCNHAEGSGESGDQDRVLVSAPRCPRTRPAPIHVPWRARVAPRPPTGRVLGVTLTRPPLTSSALAICRANAGRRGGIHRSEFASGGAPGNAVPVGGTT